VRGATPQTEAASAFVRWHRCCSAFRVAGFAAKPSVRSSASDQSGRGLLGDPAPWAIAHNVYYVKSTNQRAISHALSFARSHCPSIGVRLVPGVIDRILGLRSLRFCGSPFSAAAASS